MLLHPISLVKKSQVEFFYYLNTQWSPALQLMGAQGFFDNTTFFQ